MHFIRPDINIDFVAKRKYAAMISTFMVIASILLFVFRGPTWGIDFTGGTEVHLKFSQATDIGDLRSALGALKLGSDAVQQYGQESDNEFVVRIQDATFGASDAQSEVGQALASKFGPDWVAESSFDAQVGARLIVRYKGPAVPVTQVEEAVKDIEGARVRQAQDDNTVYIELPGQSAQIQRAVSAELKGRDFKVVSVDSVGPKVGGELRTQGFISILATLALILVYVGFRFQLAFAPGAVIALFHDVTVTVGVFILLDMLGWTHEFNLPMIGALLTIIGYSLNDTIVIYDRIRENMRRYRRKDTVKLINDSINETLARTIATSLTTVMAMTAFLVLGGPVIETFALAITLGVFFGTYSTIYIASPTIILMEDMKPWLDRVFSPSGSIPAISSGAARRGGDGGGGDNAPVTRSEERRQEREARRQGQHEDES